MTHDRTHGPKDDPTKKGGGDKSIDGVRFFMDGNPPKPQTVIVQVKRDRKPTPSYVRDLRGTMEREGAAIGALVLLYPPPSGRASRANARPAATTGRS